MFVSSIHLSTSVWALGLGCIAYCTYWIIYARYFHPLAKFPGPFWASISNLWYFRIIRSGKLNDHQKPLHDRYGPIVRIAPNDLQISDPKAIAIIYDAKRHWTKTEFYDTFVSNINPKRRDIFTERDEKAHMLRRKAVAHLYTQAAVLDYEPRIDYLIDIFSGVLGKLAESGQVVDMATLFRKYTFDVIGEIFYGRQGGFGNLREDTDYNGWMHMMDVMNCPVSSQAYLPKGTRTLFLMTGLVHAEVREAMKGFFKVIVDAKDAVRQRQDDIQAGKEVPTHDVLSKLLDIVREKGDKLNFTIPDVETELWTTIWAGSDTTAFALTAILYHLLKHPDCMDKLLKEIEDAFASGAMAEPIHYLDAVKLPYLNACVKEGIRLHPGLGLRLPRYVPAGGATIAGHYVPGGCRVGVNAIVVQSDKSIFGADADEFVPERWLRDGDRVAANMERHCLVFGSGPRTCIGKQISMTEMYKLLPTILSKYRFELSTPEWTVCRSWFARPSNVNVKVTLREEREK